MQATDAGTLTDGVLTLPSDCRQIQSLLVSTGGRDVEMFPLPPSALADVGVSTYPRGFVVRNNAVIVIGGGSEAYQLTYWQELPDLASAPMNRNWLIQREPALYLYGALIEASPYLQDDARTLVWVEQYRSILEGMQAEDDMARYGPSPSIRFHAP